MARFRFEALDGMRGFAALAVLLFHVGKTDAPWLFQHGYLAVDFFFILSGFVIAYAYGGRLLEGLTASRFLYARFVRLYPLIAAGAALGLAGYCKLYDRSTLAAILLTGLLLLPTPFAPQSEDRMALPINPPSWSLFFEFVANAVFALAAPRLSDRALALVVTISAFALAASIILLNGVDFGAHWRDFLFGIPRVCFSFFTGVGLFRLWRRGWLARCKIPLPMLLFFLALLLLAPDRTAMNGAFDGLAVFVAFPMIVACGANANISTFWLPVCVASGELSYPIYVLQGGIAPHIRDLPAHLGVSGLFAVATTLSLVVAYVAISWIILKIYDEPIRRFLTRMTAERGVQMPNPKHATN